MKQAKFFRYLTIILVAALFLFTLVWLISAAKQYTVLYVCASIGIVIIISSIAFVMIQQNKYKKSYRVEMIDFNTELVNVEDEEDRIFAHSMHFMHGEVISERDITVMPIDYHGNTVPTAFKRKYPSEIISAMLQSNIKSLPA